jgi:hypothetical protein
MKDSIELLRSTLNEWACLYGRKEVKDAEFDVWLRIFASERPDVLANALEKVTKECERMPSPGTLTKAIVRSREELQIRGAPPLRYSAGKDKQGVPCWYWSDDPKTPTYRAVDCEEGRRFLATLAIVSGKTPEECARLMEKWCA